ncbi:hypothetical protein P9X10_00415 [Bacillus cereus]|nr:hypothetical protein [Bacillus cereus]
MLETISNFIGLGEVDAKTTIAFVVILVSMVTLTYFTVNSPKVNEKLESFRVWIENHKVLSVVGALAYVLVMGVVANLG